MIYFCKLGASGSNSPIVIASRVIWTTCISTIIRRSGLYKFFTRQGYKRIFIFIKAHFFKFLVFFENTVGYKGNNKNWDQVIEINIQQSCNNCTDKYRDDALENQATTNKERPICLTAKLWCKRFTHLIYPYIIRAPIILNMLVKTNAFQCFQS